jgi:hypothetical protein
MNSSLLSSAMLGLSIGFLKWNFLEEKGMECYHGIAIKKYSYNNVNLLETMGGLQVTKSACLCVGKNGKLVYYTSLSPSNSHSFLIPFCSD